MKRISKTHFTGSLIAVLLTLLAARSGVAYQRYNDPDGGCAPCHGAFSGSTSPKTPPTVFPGNSKHVMHGRDGTYMQTDCDLCHTTGDSRNPYIGSSDGIPGEVTGEGCTGCHVGSALRAHHIKKNVPDNCYDCHDPATPPNESISPSYYGTAYTRANNPTNDVLAANTNENWSVGDFVGLDNDGDGLYDLADFDCGPPYRLISVAPEGNDLRVTWETVGGRIDAVQASAGVVGGYSNVSGAIAIPGVGLVVTNHLEVGKASEMARFYRIRNVP